MNKKSTLCQNISPSIYNYIGAGSGARGVALNFVIAKSYGRVELYIDWGSREKNEFIFDELSTHKEQIEQDFGVQKTGYIEGFYESTANGLLSKRWNSGAICKPV